MADSPRIAGLSRPGRARARARLALLGALALACAGEPAPDAGWPEGALLAARRDALASLLVRLARLEDTPLARRSRAALAALPDCPVLEGLDAGGDLLAALAALGCADPDGALAGLQRERGDGDLAFALPLASGARLGGSARIGPEGDVELVLRLPRAALEGPARLLLPGPEAPGKPLLAGAGSLLHARVRPAGGLDVAALVPAGGQGDRLFRLKSQLFAGAVLDGTWEAAVYPPPDGAPMPRAALALGFEHRAPAVAAMEDFLREIQGLWPVRRSPFSLRGADGACLLELRILPEFAPCYVATDAALVVGWNPESLRAALAGERDGALGAGGGLVVDFERVAAADARLARRARADGAPDPTRAPRARAYPWRRLAAEAESHARGVRLHVHLAAAAETGSGA